MVWSLMDNLEWSSGFEVKFGMVRVEGEDLVRLPKASLYWYKKAIGAHASQAEEQLPGERYLRRAIR